VQWLTDEVEAAGSDPRAQLWGSAAARSSTQRPRRHAPPAHTAADRHLHRYRELLTAAAARSGARAPEQLSRQLLIILEGATLVADRDGPDGLVSAQGPSLMASPL
jgi:hypothetical protein